MDPISSFLASVKIPIGRWGKAFFDFLTDNFDFVLRGFSGGMNFVLDGLVDLLLLLPPVLVVVLVALLAYYLQKSKALAIGVALGLLFIINQGLWKQTVETLVLVVAASAASMAIGVPLGHMGGAQAEGLSDHAAGPRPDADAADLRLPHPGADAVRPWQRARPDRHDHLRHPDGRAPHPSRHDIDPEGDHRGGRSFRRHETPTACGRSNCRRPCPPSWLA